MAPPAIPPSRRQYDVGSRDDMIQLGIRFFGIGPDRLVHTVAIANGLAAPPSKVAVRDPPIHKLFPQGRMKEGKTPVVSKGRVGNLKYARIAEVLFSDTFATGDTKFRYCQVFYDLVSRWEWIFPMHSKMEIGLAFATFCSQNWVPLILVRDGAGENVGGSLMKELLSRNVKSAFICPHHPQQNFAESFIGRITAMASFGMVYSGAPLFMWIYSTKAANFVNNIAASYYSRVGVWATPYELVHNERFADSSIVVPFGCAALVLLTADERQKFHSRCALMIFLHYADDHPFLLTPFIRLRQKGSFTART
jgi:hypothetical protein